MLLVSEDIVRILGPLVRMFHFISIVWSPHCGRRKMPNTPLSSHSASDTLPTQLLSPRPPFLLSLMAVFGEQPLSHLLKVTDLLDLLVESSVESQQLTSL